MGVVRRSANSLTPKTETHCREVRLTHLAAQAFDVGL